MRIAQYLKQIKDAKPINFTVFASVFVSTTGLPLNALYEIFFVEKLGQSSFQVTVIDQNRFDRLIAQYPVQTISNRVTAAKAGNSHKHRVSVSMIVLWPACQNHPVVVLNDGCGYNSPVTLSRKLLIIENLEVFLQKDTVLKFLIREIIGFTDNDLDIAFASGNAITNRYNKNFFMHYQHIDCLLDLDIGGLEIFASLLNLTRHPSLQFLLPPSTELLMTKSHIKLEEKHLKRLRQLADSCPELHPAFKLIVESGRMLEQENYLQE